MKSLFEKEEKENAINQLKIDLISRYYPLSNTEIIQFQRILNFGYSYLMNNQSVIWSLKLIDELRDKCSVFAANYVPKCFSKLKVQDLNLLLRQQA